jgi:hypothetical protein
MRDFECIKHPTGSVVDRMSRLASLDKGNQVVRSAFEIVSLNIVLSQKEPSMAKKSTLIFAAVALLVVAGAIFLFLGDGSMNRDEGDINPPPHSIRQ